MSRWLLVLVASGAAGCYRVPDDSCAIRCDRNAAIPCANGLSCGDDGLCYSGTPCSDQPGRDASIDSPTDSPDVDAPIMPDGQICYGTGLVRYCPTTLPSMRIISGALTNIDTGSSVSPCTEFIVVNGVEMCVIAADTIQIEGRVRAVGRRPLVIFGRNSVSISAQIDVSSGGAGATFTTCASNVGKNAPNHGDSAGGGAGGSFVGTGGHGGAANDAVHAAAGSIAPVPLTALRAGCGGGRGGDNSQGNGGGFGGRPGGAIYVLSGGGINVTGTINATGGGGGGGVGVNDPGESTGGGGGGSGGLIGLEAPAIVLGLGSRLLAHGGGGGGGSNGDLNGVAGSSPMITRPMDPAPGGPPAGANSGAGGSGSSGSNAPGLSGGDCLAIGATAGAGGGGGGGGAGLILKLAVSFDDMGASIYPPLQ